MILSVLVVSEIVWLAVKLEVSGFKVVSEIVWLAVKINSSGFKVVSVNV